MTHKGTVKKFDSKKGYGFITPDDEGKDVFIHWSVIQAQGFKELHEGDRVEYEVATNEKGVHATTAQKILSDATKDA